MGNEVTDKARVQIFVPEHNRNCLDSRSFRGRNKDFSLGKHAMLVMSQPWDVFQNSISEQNSLFPIIT